MEQAAHSLAEARAKELCGESRHILQKAHPHSNNILGRERQDLQTVYANAGLVIVPADKGRVSVILNTADYLQKMRKYTGSFRVCKNC